MPEFSLFPNQNRIVDTIKTKIWRNNAKPVILPVFKLTIKQNPIIEKNRKLEKIKSILAILVLYKTRLEDSQTIISLKKSLDTINLSLDMLVYDNSPDTNNARLENQYGKLHVSYFHNPENPGLVEAYNTGLKMAVELDKKWLMLLDQDTEITTKYLRNVQESNFKATTDVVCAIPKTITSQGRIISPSKMYTGGITRPYKRLPPGILDQEITGINSGTIISVDFMNNIGGFNYKFPLDMLDHWYFREIVNRKKKVYLMECNLVHSLSVNSFRNEVSVERYKSILESEKMFFKGRMSDSLIYKFRLGFRMIKQALMKEKIYFKLTWKYLF